MILSARPGVTTALRRLSLEEEATLPRSHGESHTARTQNRSVQLCSAFLSTLPLFCLAASTGKNVQFKFIKRKSLFIIYLKKELANFCL